MGDKRLVDVVVEGLALGRRIRILRHRTTRWFSPPVRHAPLETPPLSPSPRLPVVPADPQRRGDPTTH